MNDEVKRVKELEKELTKSVIVLEEVMHDKNAKINELEEELKEIRFKHHVLKKWYIGNQGFTSWESAYLRELDKEKVNCSLY